MLVGVGVDLVEISRIGALLRRHGDRARRRLFTARELSDCEERADPAECLAARFAAKEAALKALGIGKTAGVKWTDMQICRAGSGLPSLELTGETGQHSQRLGVERIWVSLSHEAGLACALVVLEARPR